jgi:LytS/YehU family sensor histidine kinase
MRELHLTKAVETTTQDLEKTQRNILLTIFAFLLIVLGLAGVIFYLKYRNQKIITHNIIIEQGLLRSQMTPHFIFNALSVLQGMILNKEENKAILYLSKLSKLFRIVLENSRDKLVLLSRELEATEHYLNLQNLEDNTYQYAIIFDETLDISQFAIPPMLIQPFVENAIEHAFEKNNEVKRIEIKVSYEEKKLKCIITDNGIGVDTLKEINNEDKKSLATTITSERLVLLSKDYKMESSITIEDRKNYNETGTKVTLIIPYKLV